MLKAAASLLATFFAVGVASSNAAPTKTTPATPRVVEVTLTPSKLRAVTVGRRITLPQLRVYDHTGRLLHDFGSGFSPERFEGELLQITDHPVAPESTEPTLQAELEGMLDPSGDPVSVPQDTDIVFVELWAEWCMPCHTQYEQLTKFLESQPQLDAILLHVEADPLKTVRRGDRRRTKGP